MTTTYRGVKGSALTHAELDANFTFLQSGTGAVASTMQDKAREIETSIFDFFTSAQKTAWSARTVTSTISAAVQAAIDAISAEGGGRVKFPIGTGDLGTIGLTTYANVRLVGEAQAYAPESTRGVELLYSGSSSAILGTNLLNSDIKNLSIDATNATGTSQRGIYLKGAWLCTLKNARVKGIGRADGYGILIDTNAGAHGAQHNYLERCECADGVIRLAGTSGSDAVTTTVLNTIRGFQYEIADSMVTLINATAEGWVTGAGFTFTGFADNLMIGCDIEGAGSPGIDTTGITSGSTREIATIWDGFTGTTRVSGDLADWVFQNSGISLVNIGQAVGNMKGMAWSDKNAAYARWLPSANDVSGGTQDGHMVLQRNNSGAGLTNQLELRRVLRLEHSLAIANVATTVLTIPIPTNVGIRITAHATGIETAAGAFSCWRTCLAVNSGGTVTTTVQAEEEIAAGGATPAFTYTISTTNILVQFNHGSATPTTINFIFEINGAIANYTKA